VRVLARAARAEAPAHAYLITGPAHVGKHTLARELAAALNCQAAPEERPCHACASCRMTLREAHPDFTVVERTEERRLRVEDVRDARGSVDWRPYQGRFKVYLFPEADDWGNVDASSSALLKTIEEPPPQVVIVLTATSVETMPITVVSRCRSVPLQPVAPPALSTGLQELYGAPPETARRLAALSNGRPGWAIDALSTPELVARREEEISQVVALSEGPLGARLLLAGEACRGGNFLESRALCLRVLEDMTAWWRDLLIVSSTLDGAPAGRASYRTPALPDHVRALGASDTSDAFMSGVLTHTDRRDELERQAARRDRAKIARGLREIEVTAGAVERNVTPRLALEALLLRLN